MTCLNCEYHRKVMCLDDFTNGRMIKNGWIVRCGETGEEHNERYTCNLFTPIQEEEEE
jgi:hypothetical protein